MVVGENNSTLNFKLEIISINALNTTLSEAGSIIYIIKF